MEPIVSVILPIRNEGRYISRCLASITRQTCPPETFEILVVDGMSDDDTRAIVREWIDRDPRIRLLDNPQRTVPFAMNAGLALARGSIILRIDGHCEIAPDYIARCLEAMERHKAACVGGPLENVGETYLARAIALAMGSPFGVGNARFRYSDRAGEVDTLAFGAYRREIFARIGHFDTELTRNQDDELNYRLRAQGETIYLDPAIKSRYYTRGNFASLWRQYFQYGSWKIRVIQKHPGSILWRHMVPGAFVAGLAGSLTLALVHPAGRWLLGGIVSAYLLGDLAASFSQARKGWQYLPVLLLIFPTLHLAYGCGFWQGLWKWRKRQR